ncbi:hypothetical protein Asal01_00569 [Fodinibius salicampi]
MLLGTVLLFVTHSGKAQNNIYGYVVSLETAKPISNATIFLNDKYGLSLGDSLRVISDSTGYYRITGIDTSTYIINAWTTYTAMNQRYAMVIQSNRIEVDSTLNVDFVFSENEFKYSLHLRSHPGELFDKNKKRTSDSVARQAVRSQLFINSRRDTIGASFIERIE